MSFVASMYFQSLDKKEVNVLTDKLELDRDALNKSVVSYSKGMLQKLGLVSCFMLDTRLIILDEPLSGLDPKARYLFKSLLRERKDRGQTILYSTHLLADAEEVCDQFSILHEGRIHYVGTPQECIQKFNASNLEEAYISCISD